MDSFVRAVRLAMRHRTTVVASLVCSLGVAVLWASNIAAVLPIIDGVMRGKSIPQLLNETVESLEQRVAENPEAIDTKTELAFWSSLEPWADRWLPVTPFATLVVVCLYLFAGTVLKNLFRVTGAYLTARLGQITELELRKEFYRRTLRLDLGTFRQTTPGDLMNRFTGEVAAIGRGTEVLLGMAIREPLKMLTCLAFAAMISWQLLLLVAIAAPLAGYAMHWLAKALKRANRRAQEEFSGIFDHLEESFSGIQAVKAFTMESRERSRFHRASKQYYRRSIKIAVYNALVSPITETMGVAMIIVAMLAGGFLVLGGKTELMGIRISEVPLTHGMLGLFYGCLAGASDPIRRLSGVFNALQRAAAASERVYSLLDRQSQVVDPAVPKTLPARIGAVQLEGVSFSYRDDQPVLDQVNLTVEPGETIAIVGPNGCGKSTLMNLVPRFYDPTTGKVMVDGIDLREVRVRDLRRRIGTVTQDTLLFDDTVADNIRYGAPEATDDEVEQAARQAHAHKFITTKLTEGYQTRCGPSGNRLSGGQRQRIALARAILRDPDILILDEATSQIDVGSERIIHKVLEEFIQNRTTFMITHRPSTLELADRIVVMDHGRIVDVGRLDELARRCELFRRLAHLDYRESA